MHTLDVLPAGIQTAGVAEVRRMAWEEGKGKETVAVAETAVALEWAEAVALAATADYVLEAEIVSVKELAADAVVEQEQVAWQDVVDDPEVQCLVVLLPRVPVQNLRKHPVSNCWKQAQDRQWAACTRLKRNLGHSWRGGHLGRN